MFERYTEPSRRAVFFARYEASGYGSREIEPEHLLLGLLREDRSLVKWFRGERNAMPEIRAEIEKRITRGEPIPTVIEVPLSQDCVKVLKLAAETSERLGHRLIEPAHLLIGILRVETSRAAQILMVRGLNVDAIQQKVAKSSTESHHSRTATNASLALNRFIAGLRFLKSDDLINFFAKNAEYVDPSGKRWNREEIWKGFESLFAHYAKKNSAYHVEVTLADSGEFFVATVLWKNALLASEERMWMHRMSVVLVVE